MYDFVAFFTIIINFLCILRTKHISRKFTANYQESGSGSTPFTLIIFLLLIGLHVSRHPFYGTFYGKKMQVEFPKNFSFFMV